MNKRPFILFTTLFIVFSLVFFLQASAQYGSPIKLRQSKIYAGIEVGSKGVKLSILEVGKTTQKELRFNIIQDSSLNTDFISFNDRVFNNTLAAITGLFNYALSVKNIPSSRIYTVISSGVKVQAQKDNNNFWITKLIDSFRIKIKEPSRNVEVINAINEAKLSHLGIVPEERRYTTFLIDIGSGNTKGGYFPNGNTNNFRLFELTWGTKSTANATEKRLGDNNTIENFSRQLYRVLAGNAADEIVYAVNVSNAYNMSDYVAFSGGIAWATAVLMYPELIDNPVVPVTYEEVVKFREQLLKNYSSLSTTFSVPDAIDEDDKQLALKTAKTVNKVFDQRSMLAGTGLLLNIMRQFEGVYEKKQFFLVKNGQVGWVSAYVRQDLEKDQE